MLAQLMASLYTKDGVPLEVRGAAVYNPSGEHFGTVQGDRVYDHRGHYRGTIVDGRLVHRSTESALMGGSAGRLGNVGASAEPPAPATGDWGDEPNITP